MTRIADLLDRDFSKPVEELVEVKNHNPHTVYSELTEYVATDRIKAEYEHLLSAMVAASPSITPPTASRASCSPPRAATTPSSLT